MSIESAKALYTKLLVDEEFRAELEEAATKHQRCEILQAAGFDYTPDELKVAKTELLESAATNDELTKTEEEKIVGGRLQKLIYPNVRYTDSICSIFDSFDVYLT
ncbi:Nif11-like leader peptide family natural product precursor [Nostoc sp.]|uniref:Nif11-like leader peptide family natural product precursor n=1 Tax=Nostoc sp. TaxID=1180 RepID=UPI002FF85BD8